MKNANLAALAEFANRNGQRGFSLIELMVAMVIGLVVTLAITNIVVVGETHKRATTAVNDVGQNAAYASYVLDRAVRSAGSGFTQSWDREGVFGCKLNVARGGATILPRNTAFPGAFSGFLGGAGGSANLRVAPLLIGKSQSSAGSDVLLVMGGNAAAGDVSRMIRSPGVLSPNELRLDNVIGLAPNDLALISQTGTADCLVEQVATPSVASPDVLPLGGTYYMSTDPYAALRASGAAYLTPLGNLAAGNAQLQLFAVGDNRTLFSYDLLRSVGTGTDITATQAIADGVVQMRALYGMDTDGNGIFNAWVDPGATGFDIAAMMASSAKVRQVVALRVVLVLRTSNYEKEVVSPASLILFGDLPPALQQTVTLTAEDQHYRYRTVDSMIPMRNVLLLP
jgi:type IV pilus assembly protein PilW